MSKQRDLVDIVFSWSLEDIFNEELYKNKVERIPESFQSVEYYLGSFVYPLLEDIRAELSSTMEAISTAPFAEIVSLKESKHNAKLLYDVEVDYWRNESSHHSKELHKALTGNVVLITEAKPESVSDLQRMGRSWTLAYTTFISGVHQSSKGTANFKVKSSKEIGGKDGIQRHMCVVFLTNITTNRRIWNALHKIGNLEVIKKVLCTNSPVEEICDLCPVRRHRVLTENLLDESQSKAVVDAICKIQCNHKSFVELIWGPPGTGKTRTLSILLWNFLRLKCRTLTCAPTNVAITEVAYRVLKQLKESFETSGGKDVLFCCLGDILIFGNMDQLTVGSGVEEIYLEYRVDKLADCFGPVNGWKYCFTSMIDLLEDCFSQYNLFCSKELINNEDRKVACKSFLHFVRDKFKSKALELKRCVSTLCTHVPRSFIQEHNCQNMELVTVLLDSFETLLYRGSLVSDELKEIFSEPKLADASSKSFVDIFTVLYVRNECICALRALQRSLDELKLPNAVDKGSIADFCFQVASSIFCTTSSSYKLHSVSVEPFHVLVIDEAAQLKECESLIPLKLPGIRHAVLIGDEFQLPAMVKSNASKEAAFGRSLFERLSQLGFSKHLLNTQYRMHPKISSFPNSKFYQNQIMNAPCVQSKIYEKRYLQGPMFGNYSFINVSGGKEARVSGGSRKNLVEVAIVMKIVQMLYKACNASKEMLSVGVVSPYNAQVAEIQQKLGQKYDNHGRLALKVKSIDGFQGGEEDIIILSTVRSTIDGSIGFISSPHRINVALTRARHCLWILGNERTLTNSGSVWEEIISNAKVRKCFFSAEEDKDLAKLILEVKKELDELDDLLHGDSLLFKSARWKVIFSDNFKKSFVRLKPIETKNLVVLFLSKLSTGWRPKRSNVNLTGARTSKILKQFNVANFYIICSTEIIKGSLYIQVLKVWDVLPSESIPKLVERLEGIFGMYTDDYFDRCKVKCNDGDLEIPMSWATTFDIVQYKTLENSEAKNVSNACGDCDDKSHGEDSKVSDSLLLMKFYSLSSGAVSHLLSGCDGKELGLPFELTDQEREISLYKRSTFILGRSGTGKTTVLTMKLFQNEQLYHIASEGFHDVKHSPSSNVSLGYKADESIEETTKTIVHQIFVTVSPKLCYAVKKHVSHLKSFVCGEKASAESHSVLMENEDDITQFSDIPNSFVDVPPKSYPLVITFHNFLMMLDRTVGTSFFERHLRCGKASCKTDKNSRSVALETFIRTQEVNYNRFSSTYWPHFKLQLTKKLDSSSVFTEIMSVIKGGLQEGDGGDWNLSREEYVSLSDRRVSIISRKMRERIYDTFLEYEKKKRVNGDFDLADLVIDLHRRLKVNRYKGDSIDFVYIDEVQDLSMRQISLFKYICRNVDEGFVFAGDTAQTIAKGVDFRFEDIRCLFYNEFVMGSRRDVTAGRKEKGHISNISHLSQNFRTHAGVLKLAQSVVDLLYYFFPLSIDVLPPESSLLNGEAPVLLAATDNAIMNTFKNSNNAFSNFIGFGAEQVILVRDDSTRNEICDYVERKALVLTIMECKGLEFQDVLLYNFFSSSPLKDQWRVVYDYMKEQALLDTPSSCPSPTFNQEKHIQLCSELKQLYVAITRTKQRLWICENGEFSKPMFDYWMTLSAVQARVFDDSFAKEMQVVSSHEDWKSRGIKLFYENNYKMAMMCFERARDPYWESWAKAADLRATADYMRNSNPEMSHIFLREAAELFDTIGKSELAAQCFFELNDYQRAGRIYWDKFGDSKLDKAGECFSLAGRFKLAAEAYARAKLYSNCLSSCIDGKLFDQGFEYMMSWKQHTSMYAHKGVDTDKIVQNFLQQGALHFYELKNNKAMMKFVKSFHSVDAIRGFLKNLNCFDELLSVEKEWGNFVEAANIAKLKKDLLLEADLLEEGGYLREASMLILWYAFSKSMQLVRSKSSPSNKFMDKDKLLEKAKSVAKNHSDAFYEFVSGEANILSTGKTIEEVLDMGLKFIQYWRHKAPKGVGRVKRSYEIERIEQELLERCALHYHDMKDKQDMMKYVRDFHSKDFMLSFLKSLNCLDELLMLEEEWGNFLKAADIAEQLGDLPRKADLLVKAGHFGEASMVILWYVFYNSMQLLRSKSSPPNQFMDRDKLLTKSKLVAKNQSDAFYEFASVEADILSNGKTFEEVLDMCLKFIQHWKHNAPKGVGRVKRSCEIEKIEQELLERGARHYHDLKNIQDMMKYVRDFHSKDFMRTFLKSLNCLDELLFLEEEWGNFLEAADVAEQIGDLSRKAGLLEKAGHFEEASMVILWYVFFHSVWVSESKGWPLKQFMQKEEFLARARLCAENHSIGFYEFVCIEAYILSDREFRLPEIQHHMIASQANHSLRGEILSSWRILDAHLYSNTSRYELNDVLDCNLQTHSEDMIKQSRISVQTLIYFWNLWRTKIVNIIDSLSCIGKCDISEYARYEEFCLNYLGVRKQYCIRNTIYHLINCDANWVREIDCRFLSRNGNLVSLGDKPFVSAARSYWCSVILTVGMKVLETLGALFDYSATNSSVIYQTTFLAHIFDVAKFLQEYILLDRNHNSLPFQSFFELSVDTFFGNVFPLDWRKSSEDKMIFFRIGCSLNTVYQAILRNIDTKSQLSYGQMGRVVVMILGTRKLMTHQFSEDISRSFVGNSRWKAFTEELGGCIASQNLSNASRELSLLCKFCEALEDAYSANWRKEQDYMSPSCLIYLVERLLFLAFLFQGYFFTTKSSFVEWLIFQDRAINSSANSVERSQILENILNFVARIVEELIVNKLDTMEWVETSRTSLKEHYPILVLRLVVVLCLICVNSGKHFDKLFNLLDNSDISSELPRPFCDALRRTRKCSFFYALSDALRKIENPLVAVSMGNNYPRISCPDAIFMNMEANIHSEEVLRELLNSNHVGSNTQNHDEEGFSWEMFDALEPFENGKCGNEMEFMSVAPFIKVEAEKYFHLLSAAMVSYQDDYLLVEANGMLDELKQLSVALELDISERALEENILVIGELSRKLRLRRPLVEPFLDLLLLQNENITEP